MNPARLNCQTVLRRHDVQNTPTWSGLDYLEVSDNQRTLTVYFLGKAPEKIERSNLRINGGRRIQNIRVLDVEVIREEDPEVDDAMVVTVDRVGDFSQYQLRVVAADEYGQPTNQPLQGVDPRYAQLSFSFKIGCPSDLDCKQLSFCPEPERIQPEISYLAKDYASFRQLILDRLSLIMPNWQERHIPDLGITLVELLAYVGDSLSYYQDAVATEAYLGTARQRQSIRRHARLMDYQMHEGCNARTWLTIKTSGDKVVPLDPQDVFFITGDLEDLATIERTRVLQAIDLEKLPAGSYEVFEPIQSDPIKLNPHHNEIKFYTWGDQNCCLPRGATAATLLDSAPSQPSPSPSSESNQCQPEPTPPPPIPERILNNLHSGDILILEEVLGAKTGVPADADPNHRHVVRLTKVEPGLDALYNQPIVEIEWSEEDALPFALCISNLGPAPDCDLINSISVARGNVILVDHGQTFTDKGLGTVSEKLSLPKCDAVHQPADSMPVARLPERFTTKLNKPALTFRQPLSTKRPVIGWLRQDDLQQALPQIALTGIPEGIVNPPKPFPPEWLWSPRSDLLASHRRDRHFVIEMDNDRLAHLRFGDGELGQRPAAGTTFHATYRVGNGTVGNVGADTISHLVLRNPLPDPVKTLTPRNPFPATGGTEPEPLEEVKLFAPQSFRRTLERAITADDYARLAEKYRDAQGRRVQRAFATLRWTGSWYEVIVAIDPLGTETADADFLDAIVAYLYPYRRIGYGLRVIAAHYVPLDIAMTVCVLPHFLRGHVKAELLKRFSTQRLADGTLGFFHPDSLSFGDPITIGKLVTTALSVEGVESITVTKLQRLNQPANQELENGILPLKTNEIAQLDNDPSFPENGKLTLNMGGGR